MIAPACRMQCLLIDNYDSFTWNLADQIGRVFGREPLVIRNDEYSWLQACERLQFDCVVVSPGPGSVTHAADFNVSWHAVSQGQIPVLGVCLGFQGIAHAHGCRIVHAPVPFHGRASPIYHDEQQLFAGIPSPFNAIRYHSLMVSDLSSELIATAHTDTGLIMGLRHRSLPKWGVQFHPESFLTEHGLRLMTNFRDLAQRWVAGSEHTIVRAGPPERAPVTDMQPAALRVQTCKVAAVADPEAVFAALFAGRTHCFWLDSQVVQAGTARFSFMGAAEDADVIRYGLQGDPALTLGRQLLQQIDRELSTTLIEEGESLPFEFRGGLVGYLSYETQALFGAGARAGSEIPDMVWLRTRRFVAFDHVQGAAWLVALTDGSDAAAADEWLQQTAAQLRDVRSAPSTQRRTTACELNVTLDASYDQYLSAIARCQQAIVDGESYQICLTNRFALQASVNPHALYLEMRSGNPAPFGAFLQSGPTCVLSTSPERFLQVSRAGRVQAKPIKGTAPRSDVAELDMQNARALASSMKDRAENLMIVDLMRNDLRRVAVQGSIEVTKLMQVESYQTVHQLVSTIEATLRVDCSLIDLLHATFPGGSISGAPKIRTLQLIDALEPSPRGVYCGVVGYLGYGRVADLSIAIRALSYDGTTLRFGGGGAITYLSDPDSEFNEMLLKALAVLRPIWTHLTGDARCAFTYQLDHNQLRLSAPRS